MRFLNRSFSQGFALPTVMILSVIMMAMLIVALHAVTVTRNALDGQYYDQLAHQAAESGVVRAKQCLSESNFVPQWTDAKPLRPNTDCSGNTIGGLSQYIFEDTSKRTGFVVELPEINGSSSVKIISKAQVELLRKSNGQPWRVYSAQAVNTGKGVETSIFAAGGGWLDRGHIGVIRADSGQLYGFGENSDGRLKLPLSTTEPSPTLLDLPVGVNYAKSVKTSGQGASFICIIGSDNQAYCRGDGANLSPISWSRVGLAAGLMVFDMSLDGFSTDAACFLAGASLGNAQSYCFGRDDFGLLGNGTATGFRSISQPQRFILPAGMTAKKIMIQNNQNCVITNTDDLYCAGQNDHGQLTGSTASIETPVKYNLPVMGGVQRKVKDVLMQYHGTSSVVHVLATDGTIWGSGSFSSGDLGNGLTSGSTGLNGTPSWFGDTRNRGGEIRVTANTGLCIDNKGGLANDRNPIITYACNYGAAQQWFLTEQGSLFNYSTGKCIDLPSNNSTNGTDIMLYTCNGAVSQTWQYSSTTGQIRHVDSGKCLDIEGGSPASGKPLQVWDCSYAGYSPQSFGLRAEANPWKGMISTNSSFCGLREDGYYTGVWCAGQNNHGQLGNVSSAPGGGAHGSACSSTAGLLNANLGVAVDNEQVDISKLSDGWKYQYDSLMVITKSGRVFGSGRNMYGKLGNGSLGDSANNYRQCQTVEFVLPAGVKAVDMSTRDEFSTYVLGSDGRVYATGYNVNGQLGDGTTVNRLLPVEVKTPRSSTDF